MKIPQKWMTALGAALLTGVLVTGAAFAAGGESAKTPLKASQGAQELMTEIQTLRQTRMEQLKAEVDSLIDKALAEGRVTTEEADRLKQGPKRPHQGPRHGFRSGMKGFPRGATEAEVKAKLDQAVQNGRITQEQADQILQKWQDFQANGKGTGKRPHGFGENLTEAEMKAKLDAAVSNGRLTQEQADQMLKRWQDWQAQQSETN